MRVLFACLILTIILTGFVSIDAQSEKKVAVKINSEESVDHGKLRIKFAELVEDSRCPEDTNCVWAGNAKLKITVSSGKGSPRSFVINSTTKPQSVSYAGYEIKLVDLTPHPRSNIRINRNGYVATFAVSGSGR
jgi:hypothetical protein